MAASWRGDDAKRATPNMPSSSSSASRSEGQREQVTSYEEVEVAVLGDPAHTARLTALLTTADPTRSSALGIERTRFASPNLAS